MKKMNLKTLVAASVLAGASYNASAATTETINIFGNIALVLDLIPTTVSSGTIADTASGATADGLATDGANVSIGTMAEKSNSSTGYEVTASSANDSKLVGVTDTSYSLPYTFNYDGATYDLSSSSSSPVLVTDSLSTSDGSVAKGMDISWTADATLAAQDYSDSITFVISAKP